MPFEAAAPDGSATVVGTIGQAEAWPAEGGETWNDDSDVWYTQTTMYDSYGEPVRRITWGNQEIRRYFHHHCVTWIADLNSSIAPKVVEEGKTWIRRDGDWKYTARAAWSHLEEDLT